jgi:chromosome segregation ATPase
MMMMDFEASDKLKFCDFDDDVHFSQRLSPFATCNCKHDVSVKIWDDDTTIMPVKRVFDKNDSLHISVKKSKVTPDYDDDKEGHDISLSPKESALVEKSYKKCEMKRRLAENSLKSINREIEECQKELRNKKTQVSCVRKINEIHNEMRGKVERKEEELNALSRKIAECTMELEFTKKELQSERKMLRQVISTRQKRNDFAVQRRKFESMKKRFEGQVKELESKLKQSEGQVEELESNEKYFKEWAKALESRDKQLNGRMMEFELMEEELESRKKKLESEEKLLERREMKLESKENQLESREKKIETKEQRIEEQEKELQSKENQFVGRVKEFESEKDKFEVNLRALGMELEFKQKQIYSKTRVVESKEK